MGLRTSGFALILCLAQIASAPVAADAPLSLTTAVARDLIDRTNAIATKTMAAEQAASNPRAIWFPLYFVFDDKGCLAGIYDMENLPKLSAICPRGHPTFTDVFGAAARAHWESGTGLVVIAAPESLANMCEPCGRARAVVEDELQRKKLRAQVRTADLQIY